MKIKRSELVELAKKHIGNDSLEAQNQIMLKIATARCARISYQTLGDNPKIDYEADIKLHDRLLKDKHLSPFEHCARAMTNEEYESHISGEIVFIDEIEDYTIEEPLHKYKGWCRNFRGWISYRSLIDKIDKV